MLEQGCVVRSAAGHDKDKFYVIVGIEQDCVWIADGRLRKLAAPKRKNVKHIRTTRTVLDLKLVNTDRQLRIALKPFNDALAAGKAAANEEGGN